MQCWLSLLLDPWDLIQGGISLRWHKVLLFLQSWFLGVATETTRGLKSYKADWEIGRIICPWNIMWHNMTPGHLYVKVNISAWQLDTSGQEQTRADKAPVSLVLYLHLRKRCCDTMCVWSVKVCVELLFLNLIPIDIVSCWVLKRHCLACSLSLFLQEEVRDSPARALALKARKYTMKRRCEDDLLAGEDGGV